MNWSTLQMPQKPARSYVGINEAGRPVGEGHHRAKLTNHEVDLMLELRDEGYSYAWLAIKFEVNKSCAAKICTGQRRAQHPVAYRRALPSELKD